MPAVEFAPTSDLLIRAALLEELTEKNRFKEHTRVIPELTLPCESVRVDVAVVNGIMHGYELKSDVDTLNRLDNQVIAYNSVFDKVTLVVGKKHAAHAISLIPRWWGVTVAKSVPEKAEPLLIPIRDACENPAQNILAITNLLLKSEAVDCLISIGCEKGYSNKSKREICEKLVEQVDAKNLKALVRDKLINRIFVREKQAVLSLQTCGD